MSNIPFVPRIKVAFVAPFDLTKKDGNTIRAVGQLRLLIKESNIDLVVFCSKKDQNLEVRQIEISSWLGRVLKKISLFRGSWYIADLLLTRVDFSGFDIVHCSNYHGVLIFKKTKKRRFKILIDYHAWKSELMDSMMSNLNLFRRFVYRCLLPWVKLIEARGVALSDGIIVASDNIRDIIINKYQLNSNRIIIVHNYIDVSEYLDNCYLLDCTLGVIGPFDDIINDILPSVVEIAKRVSNKIIVVGSLTKSQKNKLIALENIVIRGRVSNCEYYRFLSSVGLIILPYFFSCDGGGPKNKVLDACASQTPIITTSAGCVGLGEDYFNVVNSVDGFVESIADLSDNKKRMVLGRKSKDIILRDFNPKIENKKLVDLYINMMQYE